MKSIFNFVTICLLSTVSLQAHARDIVLIENLASLSEGELLKSILIKKFHIPRELITLRNSHLPCDLKSDAIVHLCLETDGELVVKKMNHYVVRNSLGVFLNHKEEQEGEE